MLGMAMVETLTSVGVSVSATTRDMSTVPDQWSSLFVEFDAVEDDLTSLVAGLGKDDYVVNCIGVIKTYIDDSSESLRRRATEVNARFPYLLSAASTRYGFHVIQIATDCVYSGSHGHYDETAPHDALDVYGKTKSLGEVPHERFLNLRASIIGVELRSKTSLLEWVLAHDAGTSFGGYVDHRWNGVTAQAFARVACGVVTTGGTLAGTFHLVPADEVSKYELSRIILSAFGRDDVLVEATQTPAPIDRTLRTLHKQVNEKLWADAGFERIPRIIDMVVDLAQSPKRRTEH